MSAIDLHARASADFDAKLAATRALLQRVSTEFAPITQASSLGEDFRAGRWWWEDEAAKECGLHVKSNDTKEKVSA